MWNMRSLGFAVAAMCLALVASGCSDDERKRPSPVVSEVSSAEQVEAVGGDTITFGEPFEFEDGLSVTVSRPEEFTPSSKAIKGDEDNYVKFTVSVENGTTKKFNPADVTVTVTSGGGQAGDVIDKKQKMSLAPVGPVKPGGRISWVQGFGVLNPDDVAVVVQAGMSRVPVAFLT